MEANELRKGNWVLPFDKKKPAQVIGIFENSVYLQGNGTSCDYSINEIEPFFITKEILLNNGFEKIGQYYRIKPHVSAKEIEIGLNEEGVFRVESLHMKPQVIEYVHHLQNKVFFCENEELIFNL